MRGIWQAAATLAVMTAQTTADESPQSFPWDAPEVAASVFSRELGLLDSEREEYATNLATLASNHLATAKASPASLPYARRMLGLALHLSPRNKRAVVVNFQLSKGTN